MQIDIRSTTNLTNVDNSVDCSCRFYLIWALASSLFAAYLWYEPKLSPKPIVDNASSVMFVTDDSLSIQQKLVANSQVIQQYCDSNDINFRVYPANAETGELEPWAVVMLTEGSKRPPCLVKYDGSTVEILNVPSTIEEAMEQIK